MRLIDADAFKYAQRYARADPDSNKLVPVYAVDHKQIDEVPTVDAVPVVRCRECVYYVPGTRLGSACLNAFGLACRPKDDDFCSRGERKDQSADPGKMETDDAPESPD